MSASASILLREVEGGAASAPPHSGHFRVRAGFLAGLGCAEASIAFWFFDARIEKSSAIRSTV